MAKAESGKQPIPAVPSSRIFIAALTDADLRNRLRALFAGLSPSEGVRALVTEIIDPQLLRVVLGQDAAAVWTDQLESTYGRLRAVNPAHFHDVDATWLRQRNYWHALIRAGRAAGSGASTGGSAGGAAGSGGSAGARRAAAPRRAASPAVPARPGKPKAVVEEVIVRRPGAAPGGARQGPAAAAPAAGPKAAAFGVAAFTASMLESPQAYRAYRRAWIVSGAGADQWDAWALPADLTVVERVRDR